MDQHWELFLRIIIGTVLGGVIGYERDVHRRPAGLRTHVIVALAASTFMVVSTQFVHFQSYGKGDLVTVDTDGLHFRFDQSVPASALSLIEKRSLLRRGPVGPRAQRWRVDFVAKGSIPSRTSGSVPSCP